MTPPLVIWLLCDGKPGHENQSLGLADALARRVPCDVHRISLTGKHGLIRRLKSALADSENFPKPDLIIATGHATHPALIWLARKHRARSIVIMKPSLPMSWFDLCIAPSHDFPEPPQRENLLISRGALNRVAPASGEKSGQLILIGGPSGNHGWDGEKLLTALAPITATGHWQLTDSRRTPAGFPDAIRKSLPAIEIFPHQETTPDWLPRKLAAAAEAWVTEDSVSMIYEALSSGAKVGLLPVPELGTSRVLRGIAKLVDEGFLTRFQDWEKSRTLTAPPETLREADRCAAEVISRFNL
ncbi:MAG: mitochondrial fission ELM1 family protein [Luteolibacter sp.]